MNTQSVYKIRSKTTGLFSPGGTGAGKGGHGTWTNKGKVWNSRNAVSLHLRQFNSVPDDWEVVEIQMVEASTASAVEWLNDLKKRTKVKHDREEAERRQRQIESWREQIDRAQRELEKLQPSNEQQEV